MVMKQSLHDFSDDVDDQDVNASMDNVHDDSNIQDDEDDNNDNNKKSTMTIIQSQHNTTDDGEDANVRGY